MYALTLLDVVIVTVVVAAADRRCAPVSWKVQERAIGFTVSEMNSFHKGFNDLEMSTVYYDKLHNRSAQLLNRNVGAENVHLKVITDYNAGQRYMIDLAESQCQVQKITWGFPEICVPDNADDVFDYVLGMDTNDGNYIDAVAFDQRQDYHGDHVSFTVTLTNDLYVPVRILRHGLDADTYLFVSLLGDVVSPVPPEDSDVFTPPSDCTTVESIPSVFPGSMATLMHH
ncbi:uncharacterized protein [Haliotis cracherodii]|uniref:uncharacterized protein n=1 Tax=Haliotis cracherodii TaxID=6455 RepID=UPI0039EB8144